ncbi:MAG: phosphopantetheine-binding protein [Ideonella sp.]
MSSSAQEILPGKGHAASIDPATGPSDPAVEAELASLMVEALNLEVKAAEIDPVAPLYGDGLGLDSIDILEVALEVSRRYGFELRSDDEHNKHIFGSLRSLATHVAAHRTR